MKWSSYRFFTPPFSIYAMLVVSNYNLISMPRDDFQLRSSVPYIPILHYFLMSFFVMVDEASVDDAKMIRRSVRS